MKPDKSLLEAVRRMPALTHNHTRGEPFDFGSSAVFAWLRKCDDAQQFLFNFLARENILIFDSETRHWQGNPKIPRQRKKRIPNYAFLAVFPVAPSEGISYSDAVLTLSGTPEASFSASTIKKRIRDLLDEGLIQRVEATGMYIRTGESQSESSADDAVD